MHFYDISSILDPVKWRAEIQSFKRYMSLQNKNKQKLQWVWEHKVK